MIGKDRVLKYRIAMICSFYFVVYMCVVSSTHAQDIPHCERFGTLNGKYLEQTPPRLVIYDANFVLPKSVPIYKVEHGSQSVQYQRVNEDALEIGATLSYKVNYVGNKRRPEIKEIWILPRDHCRS